MNPIYRQGDVLIVKVGSLPKGAKKYNDPNEPNRVVLAYGEITGHAHALSSKLAQMYKWEGDTLIEVQEGAQVVHEEHATIPLTPGVYKIIQQQEYTPEAIRNVAD